MNIVVFLLLFKLKIRKVALINGIYNEQCCIKPFYCGNKPEI